MLVPQFWAEARKQGKVGGRRVTVRRFGWSDISQEDASQNAEKRVNEAYSRIETGETLLKREPKRAYNGAEGVPIREEILDRFGEAILTRNGYGAKCLNTPNVFFADIDFGTEPGFGAWLGTMSFFLLGGLAVFFLVGSYRLALVVSIVGLILSYPFALFIRNWVLGLTGGPEAVSIRRVERFIQAHPQWNMRIYRTPAGLRLLATHKKMDPLDPIALQAFQSLGTDPIYVQMCLKQNCFRARVSPKPWRIGLSRHIPSQAVWPVPEFFADQRKAWQKEYDYRSTEFASCRFLKEVGSGIIDPGVHSVQLIHDELCQANSQLPLA